MANKSNRGRKLKEYDESEVEQIIERYVEEHKGIGEIKPYAIYLYAKGLYDTTELGTFYKESFWRSETQPGRKLINKWNNLFKKSQEVDLEVKVGFYDTGALIGQNKTDLTRAVMKKLELNETIGRKYVRKYAKKEEECEALKQRLKELEQKVLEYQDDIETLQSTLFDITLASTNKRSKMTDILSVKGERSKMVESILKHGLAGLNDERFDWWLKGKVQEEENSNVVNFQEEKKSSAFDDFSF